MSLGCLFGHSFKSRVVAGEPRWLDLSCLVRMGNGPWEFQERGEFVPQTRLIQFCPRCFRLYSPMTGEITEERMSEPDRRAILSQPRDTSPRGAALDDAKMLPNNKTRSTCP